MAYALSRLLALVAPLFLSLLPSIAHAQSCASATPEAPSTTATAGAFRVYAHGVQNASAVWFPTWSSVGGQDDLQWYSGVNQGGGVWYADVNLGVHKMGAPDYGVFETHVYAQGQAFVGCAATSWIRTLPNPTCAYGVPQSGSTTAVSGAFRVWAHGVQQATTVYFPTWGTAGGQDDLVWYAGTDAGGGVWYADINLANHKAGNPEFGVFETHVYAASGGTNNICASMSWARGYSNSPPLVSLTYPLESGQKQGRPLGGVISLSAAASDDQGVNRVEYYANGVFIGQAFSPPYTVNFQPGVAGVYDIVARAVDVGGLSRTSGTGFAAFARMVPILNGNQANPTWRNNNGHHSTWNLPTNVWYMDVRHTTYNPTSIGLTWDLSRYFTTGACTFPIGGGYCTLTNYTTPANGPAALYQVGQVDGTPNDTSGFQQSGGDFSSFINTFATGCPEGHTHSVYETRPVPHLTVFDGDARTELVMEVELEVPQVYRLPGSGARTNLSLFAYFTDNATPPHTFGVLMGVFDDIGETPAGAGHDGFFAYMSTPFANNAFMSVNARNGAYNYPGGQNFFTTNLWKGKKLFRGFVSREKFVATLNAVGFGGLSPEHFKLYNAGVLHEIVTCSTGISNAYHGSNFRIFSARYY